METRWHSCVTRTLPAGGHNRMSGFYWEGGTIGNFMKCDETRVFHEAPPRPPPPIFFSYSYITEMIPCTKSPATGLTVAQQAYSCSPGGGTRARKMCAGVDSGICKIQHPRISSHCSSPHRILAHKVIEYRTVIAISVLYITIRIVKVELYRLVSCLLCNT